MNRKDTRHFVILLMIVLAGLVISLVLTWLYLVIKFGPISFEPLGVQISQQEELILIEPRHATSDSAILFFPGNLVDKTRYYAWLSEIAIRSSSPIYIVSYPLNIASLKGMKASDLSKISGFDEVTAIGHSAGAAMSCNYANLSSNITSIITVNGYCYKSSTDIPIYTYLSQGDDFIDVRSSFIYDDLYISSIGDHTTPLHAITSQEQQELISKIIGWISIQENR